MDQPMTDRAEIERLIAEHGRWWHEIELAPGLMTPGDDSNRMKVPILDGIGFPRDMHGLRVLDIGCSDGFFSFEMERRGARVIAMDFVPEDYTGFTIAKRILGSSVEYRMDNVYNLSPETYGTFDLVLFMGVLYHLRNPLGGLDAIRSVMTEGASLFVGTTMIDDYLLLADGSLTTLDAINPELKAVPLWQAYPGDTLNGDFTNCFAPNERALVVALEEAQFEVQVVTKVSMGGYARATAISDPLLAKYQRLDGRLQKSPFDPSVPYFLDEDGSVHAVTGGRTRASENQTRRTPGRWWEFWCRGA
jgi:tRNA (mo5U34)-methyltransferase